MAAIAKTIVATGASSGIGFEAIKHLLTESQPYKLILGARDTARTQAAYDAIKFDATRHSLTVLPLELSNLKDVRTFAQQAQALLGQDKLDYLLLNAAMAKSAQVKNPFGTKWCEAFVVNHLSQHYLIHLLREKLEASHSRVVIVSSGGVRSVSDPSTLEGDLLGGADTKDTVVYSETKFTQLVNAHWWRRQFGDKVTVVATSPGLVPNTGLSRHGSFKMTMDMPDAISVPQGGQNVLRAFFIDDLPSDPEQIFLTSWGEWWPKTVYEKTLDKKLQDKWSPSKEEIEQEANLA